MVYASVHLGEPNDIGGFEMAVDIKIEGVPDDVLKAGHEVRYYLLDISNNFNMFCLRRAPTAAPYNTRPL